MQDRIRYMYERLPEKITQISQPIPSQGVALASVTSKAKDCDDNEQRLDNLHVQGSYLADEVLVYPADAAATAGGLTGRRNAPAQRTRDGVASLPDETGRFAGENREILFGEIEVPIFHARGQYGRELDVGSNAGAPASHGLSCGKRRDCNFDVPDRDATKAVDGDAPRGKG